MKSNRTIMLTMLFLSLLFFTGCTVVQLEDRTFPMAIGIDKLEGGNGLKVSFDFPDLKEASGGNKEDETPEAVFIDATEFYKAQKAYENNTNRMIDYNHLKSIVLGKDYISDPEMLRKLFSWLEYQEVLARNTCLFIADTEAIDILNLTEGTQGSVGAFLEEMVQSQTDFKKSKVMTIGKVMNQWHNQNETIFIPVLTEDGGIPVIKSYAVFKRFVFVDTISVDDVMKAYLTQNMVKKLEYELSDKTVVEIQNLKRTIEIDNNDGQVVVTVKINGNALPKNLMNSQTTTLKQLKVHLDEQLRKSMMKTAVNMLQEHQIDITNSFILLGGHNRELYDLYLNNPDEYEQKISYQFDVDMTVLNY